MSPDQVPPTPAQLELLEAIAKRAFPGPLVKSPERDRLRRLGLLEAFQQPNAKAGQAQLYRLTAEGERFMAARVRT